MNLERLGNLACLAMEDASMRPVLQDSIEEAGCGIEKIGGAGFVALVHLYQDWERYPPEPDDVFLPTAMPKTMARTRRGCRAIAAAILGGAWVNTSGGAETWAAAERCRCHEPCATTKRPCKSKLKRDSAGASQVFCAGCGQPREWSLGECPESAIPRFIVYAAS